MLDVGSGSVRVGNSVLERGKQLLEDLAQSVMCGSC